MKIKTDFITNSSSTSFVIISKEEFTLSFFLKQLQVQDNSIGYEVFKELFDIFKEKLEPFDLSYIYDKGSLKYGPINNFSEGTVNRIKAAIQAGYKVYYGNLHTDNNASEAFFCCESFIIDSGYLFIDASNHEW